MIEGYMPFKGFNTYYRIVGEDKPGTPIVLLHGGPGSTHNYFEVLDSLGNDRPVIMYDQIGCGLSQAYDQTQFFNMETWLEELIRLRNYLKLKEVHILGQSWGGMLLLEYLCNHQPEGIKSAILASTLPSSQLWGQEQHRMIKELPLDMQQAIKTADETGNYTTEECIRATNEYMLRHCAPIFTNEDPECLTRPKKSGSLAYITGWGPNEFTPLGNLKNYNVINELKNIKCPVLITSGTNDLSTPLINKTMFDGIANAKWELFANSRHMAFAEENKKYLELLSTWLKEHD